MKKNFIWLHVLTACLVVLNPLNVIAQDDKAVTSDNLRILDLLPNLLIPLAIDPAVPSNFVARTPNGKIDLYDWVYWGPEDVLKDYFANPSSLVTPLLRVKLSANVAQNGPDSFTDMESLKLLEKNFSKGFIAKKTLWGDYPVQTIQVTIEKITVFTAWVGLNDPEAGWTLMFNLVYPEKENRPDNEDQQLWNNFIQKTTQLKDGEFFKALGQDLQDGYTIIDVGGAKLKMIAEKRQSDGLMQIVVISENSDVKFTYTDMSEGLMGAKWKLGEPLVKVYGECLLDNKNYNLSKTCVTSIFYKSVSEFSYEKDDNKNLLIFQKKFNKG